jgi:tetratricopeptide (TPR) repeat protein
MSLTKLQRSLLLLLWSIAQPARADLAADIADLSARIDYGFYAEEQRVIDAARSALERLPEQDPSVRYYRALAAFRLAQLPVRDGDDLGELLDDCAQLAVPTEDDEAAAEAWILVAACASLGVHKGFSQQRRRDQALAHAREIDATHPRIALVEAWSLSDRPGLETAPVRDQAAERLKVAAEEFRAWNGRYGSPQWGEAEALAQLGEIYLQRGESRAARDLIERALLIAPDYRFALSLRGKVQGSL